MGVVILTQLQPADAKRVTSFARQRCEARRLRFAPHSFGQSRLGPKTVRALPLLFLLLLFTGCSWTDKHGTQHTAIIGFGVVSRTNETGITAEHLRVVGSVMERNGIGLGLIQRHTVQIDPSRATNDLVAVRATPFHFSLTHQRIADCPPQNIDSQNTETP